MDGPERLGWCSYSTLPPPRREIGGTVQMEVPPDSVTEGTNNGPTRPPHERSWHGSTPKVDAAALDGLDGPLNPRYQTSNPRGAVRPTVSEGGQIQKRR